MTPEILADTHATPLSEGEKALFAINKSFWDFVDNTKYHDKILDIITYWHEYKEKYRRSAEPTEQIRSAQDKAAYGEGRIGISDRSRDYKILEHNIMKELCEIGNEDVAIGDIPTIGVFDESYIETFLRDFEKKTHRIETLPNGKIRLTEEGRKYCHDY